MLVARMVPLLVHVLWSTLHIATAAAGEPSAACRAAMTPAEPPMLFLGGPPPARLPARHCTEADVRAGLAAGCAPDDVRELCAEPVVPAFPMGVWLQVRTSLLLTKFLSLDL